jgi:porphyrinogen peroxidase
MRDPEPQAVLDLLADLGGLTRSVGFRNPDGDLTRVAGMGSALWDRHTAVSTPGDLLFHIRARRIDLCFELAGLIAGRLGEHATVVDEVHGFKYLDRRDLLGFVDGTENPTGRAARDAVTIGDEDPDFAGGSHVVVQKYLHDMTAWNALSTEEQERVVGRTKLDDVEMADDVKPANSHIALNVITDEYGDELAIVRDNMPFGRVGAGEYGTYFIGYTARPAVIERMLTNMFVGEPVGNTDRILDFSTAVTGTLFFVPTADFSDRCARPHRSVGHTTHLRTRACPAGRRPGRRAGCRRRAR